MKKNFPNAFTLIELVVAITIIVVIALGVSKLNFNTISDKQKLKILSTKIVSNFETIRGNALMGKGVGVNLDVPELYWIDFSTTGSGNILTRYLTGGVLETYKGVIPVTFGTESNEISSFSCTTLNGGSNYTSTTSSTGTIIMEGGTLTLTGACNQASSKILELKIKKRQYTETIQINTLNGLISIQ